jgi:hypothetical protein
MMLPVVCGAQRSFHSALALAFGNRPRHFVVQEPLRPLPPRRPVDRNHADTDERHSDFGLDVGQKIRNPPRRIGVPINERRIAGRIIP